MYEVIPQPSTSVLHCACCYTTWPVRFLLCCSCIMSGWVFLLFIAYHTCTVRPCVCNCCTIACLLSFSYPCACMYVVCILWNLYEHPHTHAHIYTTHAHMHTHAHTHTHTHTHACTHDTHTCTLTHTQIHTHTHTHTDTHAHTRTHTHTHTCTTHTHTHAHTHAHTHTHTYTNIHIYTRMHTHMPTHMPPTHTSYPHTHTHTHSHTHTHTHTYTQVDLMDHPLHTVTYVADIDNVLVIMAHRATHPSSPTINSKEEGGGHTPKLNCHILEAPNVRYLDTEEVGQVHRTSYCTAC